MKNINTKTYWEDRFKNGDWNRSGRKQTMEYALANIKHIVLDNNFEGSILDFGCALGDSIPIYKKQFPLAKIKGIDISESAIQKCKKRFGDKAFFLCGDYKQIKKEEIIIASHIMEHLTNDKDVVKNLLDKCNELYVFVPFKEIPLYFEHVNFYDENYYDGFPVIKKNIFEVSYKRIISFREFIKNLLLFKFTLFSYFKKDIIMFRFKGISN